MLKHARPATRLPAQDLERARRFYADKLGLQPADEREGGLLYRCGGREFALFESAGASPGTFTQMGWEVDDIEAVVAELRNRGVTFEEVDLPGLKTKDGIADISGNYPLKGGRGERGAWFRDSEGNLLGLGQPLGPSRRQVARACYEAYVTGDRTALDRHLADDLVFSSPPDPALDRDGYFERCWANADLIEELDVVRLVELGDEVLVTYDATRSDGGRFRNTEVLTFAGDRIARIEVYFGWTLTP